MKIYDESCLEHEKSNLKDELRVCEYCTDSIEAHNECRSRVANESRKRTQACAVSIS